MPVFQHRSSMPVPAEALFAWHARPGAFERLVPPWENIRVVAREGSIRDGDRLVVEIRKGPVPIRWTAIHRDYDEGRQFADVQVEGPLAEWVHTHRFIPNGPDASFLEDHIDYQLPLGVAGRLLGGALLRGMLERTHGFRHRRTRDDLQRHWGFREHKRQRIVVSGASGLVGRALAPFLTTGGHQVDSLVRRSPKPHSGEIAWDPDRDEIDAPALEGADAVIHLSGESVAQRWTPAVKEAIRTSRVRSTELLARTLAGLKRPPRTLLAASAIGFYGNRGDEELTEESAPGDGFLADVCREWEAAAAPAVHAGIRVLHVRIGIVLTPKGGALAKLLPPFRLGGGGPIAGGRQWMSWIALDDLVGLFHHCLFSELSGPVNAVAPQPVTNAEFARAMGRVLRRPAFLPIPGLPIRLLFGEMGAATILSGQRVLPARALADGFQFLYPDLDAALRGELGGP